MSKKIPMPEKEFLLDLHFNQYKSVRDIADICGVRDHVVRNWFIRYGIKSMNGHTLKNSSSLFSDDIKKLIYKRLAEQYPLEHIAKEVNCTKMALYTFIKNNNLQVIRIGKYGGYRRTSDKRFYNPEWLNNEHNVKGKSVIEISKELHVHPNALWNKMRELKVPCRKNQGISTKEKDIVDFIKEIYSGVIVTNTRQLIPPYEIDIYLPEKNLAIEFNGSYYHSYNSIESSEQRNYHFKKFSLCQQRGIHLLSIFEYDWDENSERWKKFIKSKLGKTSYHLGARECVIVDKIPNYLVEQFYENNHLQGYTTACAINFALSCKDKIVAMMSFCKSRYQKEADWELMRFAVDSEYRIPGAASKLLSAFCKRYSGKIVSYSDNSYSYGKLYEKLGFVKLHDIAPRYGYIDCNTRKYMGRLKCQKKKLPGLLKIFDDNLTEAENMFANGYRRIWDCGKKTWIR